MSNDRTSAAAAAPAPTGEPAAAPDERDAAIARLERALTEERQRSAAFRTNVEQLEFKLEVLEKSYAKQLADARERAESAARKLAEREAELEKLADKHNEVMARLAAANRELERTSIDREFLREPRARSAPPAHAERRVLPAATHDGTINALLGETPWSRDGRAPEGTEPAAADAAEADAPPGEMLSPELVFTGKDDDGDDDGR